MTSQRLLVRSQKILMPVNNRWLVTTSSTRSTILSLTLQGFLTIMKRRLNSLRPNPDVRIQSFFMPIRDSGIMPTSWPRTVIRTWPTLHLHPARATFLCFWKRYLSSTSTTSSTPTSPSTSGHWPRSPSRGRSLAPTLEFFLLCR